MLVVDVVVTVSAVATPLVLIVATAVFDEVQVAEFVRSTVEPFASSPVATKFVVPPDESTADVGLTEIETRFATFTVIDDVAVKL